MLIVSFEHKRQRMVFEVRSFILDGSPTIRWDRVEPLVHQHLSVSIASFAQEETAARIFWRAP